MQRMLVTWEHTLSPDSALSHDQCLPNQFPLSLPNLLVIVKKSSLKNLSANCRPTVGSVGQLLALSANCGRSVDCHAVSLSPRIQIHQSEFKPFLMNIINYKPKMELLFILHDFMLPPSFLIQPHLPQLSFSKSWAGMDWKGSGTRHCCGSEAALVFWSSTTGLLGGGNVAAPRWYVLGKVLWFISLEYHLGKLWRCIYTCSAKIKEEDCAYKHVSTLELKHDRECMKLTYQ